MTLDKIGEHYYALESILINNDSEITEEIDQWLAEYQAKQEEKDDVYCYLIRKFEDIATESQRLAGRASNYGNKTKTTQKQAEAVSGASGNLESRDSEIHSIGL